MLGTHMVWLLSCVDAHVALQRLQVAEASPTGGAGIGLLAGVDEDVCAQMRHLGGEGTLDGHASGWRIWRFCL